MASQWPEAIRGPLLETQYRAKRQSIRTNYPRGNSLIILGDEEPIGWLFSHSDKSEIRVVEIVIHSRHRSKGLGTALLRSLAERAERDGIPVRLSVGVQNQRAISFYLRLGFQRTGGDDVNLQMERA